MSVVTDTALNAGVGSLEVLASRTTERVSVEDRIRLCRECADHVVRMAPEWVRLEADVKELAEGQHAEAVLSGPCAVLRQLQLSIQTLSNIVKSGKAGDAVFSAPDSDW